MKWLRSHYGGGQCNGGSCFFLGEGGGDVSEVMELIFFYVDFMAAKITYQKQCAPKHGDQDHWWELLLSSDKSQLWTHTTTKHKYKTLLDCSLRIFKKKYIPNNFFSEKHNHASYKVLSNSIIILMICRVIIPSHCTFSGISHWSLDGGGRTNSGSPLQWPSSLYLRRQFNFLFLYVY